MSKVSPARYTWSMLREVLAMRNRGEEGLYRPQKNTLTTKEE